MKDPDASEKPERQESNQKDGAAMAQGPFERLLLPIANETDAEAACTAIRPYVDPHDTQLVVVHFIEETLENSDEVSLEARQNQANAIFEFVRNAFADTVHPVHTKLRYGTDTLDEIFASADKFDVTAIGVTHGQGTHWGRLLTGDQGSKLLMQSNCPVIVFSHSGESRNLSEEINKPYNDGDPNERRRLLVPIDGSDPSMKAVEHACSAYSGAELTILHVLNSSSVDSYQSTGEPSNDREVIKQVRQRGRRRKAEQMFQETKEMASKYDAELVTRTITGKNVPRAIINYAEQRDADQIVIGSRGRSGLGRMLLGSVAEAVVHRASDPVTVVPARVAAAVDRSELSRVLVPFDGSPAATSALLYAVETFPDAVVTVAYVVDPVEGLVDSHGQSLRRAERWQKETEHRSNRILEDAMRVADEHDAKCSTVTLMGTPAQTILAYAEDFDTDHIIIGTRGRRRLWRTLLGSVSETIVRQSPVPVTVVR